MALSGPAAGLPCCLYGNGENAKSKSTAKRGISQARMSDARPVLTSWYVMYFVGSSVPWPASSEMMNCEDGVSTSYTYWLLQGIV